MTQKFWSRTQRLILLVGLTIRTFPGTSLWGGPLQDTPVDSQATESATATNSASTPDMREVIQRFAAKESEFRRARDNYTYRQIVKVQELSPEGDAGGTYQVDSDIIFTPQGTRTEKVVYAPLSTLRRISISPEDERDLKSIQPFVLTTEDLPKYNVQYQGRQKVDELSTFVFRVGPKQLAKGERYFEGLVWVDDRDYQIVKTYGKAVPDIRKNGQENLFPRFETYREQIDGKYWFPTWTGADDTLYFSNGPQRIRMLVRYENYKQFKTETTITYGDEAEQPPEVK
ncbi:MAG: hypothetical protein HYX73_01000 [Acidobacteria bacterium]|nr:hypothetical protein [Acidobacteriota bacterium]